MKCTAQFTYTGATSAFLNLWGAEVDVTPRVFIERKEAKNIVLHPMISFDLEMCGMSEYKISFSWQIVFMKPFQSGGGIVAGVTGGGQVAGEHPPMERVHQPTELTLHTKN